MSKSRLSLVPVQTHVEKLPDEWLYWIVYAKSSSHWPMQTLTYQNAIFLPILVPAINLKVM